MEITKFCSECKYAKEVEMTDGIKICCGRLHNPQNIKAAEWAKMRGSFRKLNAPACRLYEDVKS